MTDEALPQLAPQFETICAKSGRPSVLPEQLLRGAAASALHGAHGQILVEQFDFNLLLP